MASDDKNSIVIIYDIINKLFIIKLGECDITSTIYMLFSLKRPCLLFTFFLLSCLGCTNVNEFTATPMVLPMQTPVPEFLALVDPKPGTAGSIQQRICISIIPKVIWEVGDTYESLASQIEATFELQINGRIVPKDNFPFSLNLLEIPVEKDGYIGTAPGTMFTCLKAEFTLGIQIARILLLSTSGKIYSYTWSFRVDEIRPNSGDNRTDLLQDYLDAIVDSPTPSPPTATAHR